jgi:hypothetical protein
MWSWAYIALGILYKLSALRLVSRVDFSFPRMGSSVEQCYPDPDFNLSTLYLLFLPFPLSLPRTLSLTAVVASFVSSTLSLLIVVWCIPRRVVPQPHLT